MKKYLFIYSLIIVFFINSRLFSCDQATRNMRLHEELNIKLRKAAQNGNLKEVKRLIENGANINTSASTGDTPLSYAISYNSYRNRAREYYDVINYLIEHGANTNVVSWETRTPLMLAISKTIGWGIEDTKNIIDKLLNAGADINFKNIDGKTALDVAQKVNPEITAFIKSKLK